MNICMTNYCLLKSCLVKDFNDIIHCLGMLKKNNYIKIAGYPIAIYILDNIVNIINLDPR